MADRCSQLEKRLTDTKEKIMAEVEDKQLRMHEKVDMIERSLTMSVDKTIRTVDILKSDLFEALEQKYDQIQ